MRDAGGGDVVDLPHQEVVPPAALLPRLPVERLHDYGLDSFSFRQGNSIQQPNVTCHDRIECVAYLEQDLAGCQSQEQEQGQAAEVPSPHVSLFCSCSGLFLFLFPSLH